ncbi:MAG: hypothetical protein AAF915_25240 [Cyanobacteria bacterium P01_D01_bin.50]
MFKKVVLPTIAISSMLFASSATLLAQYGSQEIEIKVDNQDFFYGQIRELFSPGMGVLFSLTLVAVSIVVIGYFKSVRRKNQLDKQLSSLKAAILEKESQIQELRQCEKINDSEFINLALKK